MTVPTPPIPQRTSLGSMDAGVLRIFGAPGTAAAGGCVGLGLLVTEQFALTCAHVVAAALGIGNRAQSLVGSLVGVDSPLLGVGQPLSVPARVEQWIPAQASGAGDVAVLRLGAPLAGAAPVRLVEAEQVWGHSARAFGLPDGRPGGVWHSGVLRHRQANGWIQIDLAGNGYRVSPGFSGGPVWDDELAGVVGMMAVAELGSPPAGYLIPTSGLLGALPDLRALVAPPSPFRGLRPFAESDAAQFHGRRAESDQVAEVVAGERWTTLMGPSGCGKSSLAMAGVIPKRRKAGDCPIVIRPGHHASPLHALAAGLLPLLEPDSSETHRLVKTSALAGVLAEQGLHEVVARVLETPRVDRLLVVVDQFEELLDFPSSALDDLARVLFGDDAPTAVKVLCTLRADFLEPMLAHPVLGPIVSKRVVALEPMRPEQLREIITKPVSEIPGARYEQNLVERILTDAGTEPGALPLLGFTLDLLWERQTGGWLTHQAYSDIGGVAGALGAYADQAWNENIPTSDEPAATRLLTQLARIPIGATAATRRIAPRAELGELGWRIAQRLAATRLLVLRSGEGPESVELVHEALITGWDRLARQISAERTFLDWRESLRYELDRWQRSARPSDLLPTQTGLAVARQWMRSHAKELSPAEHHYLNLGRVHRRAQTRRRRGFFSGLVIVIVGALVFGSLFVYAQQQSSVTAALANSRALAQSAQDTADYDPALSVMTAMAAYQTSPTEEARNQLLREYLQYSLSDRMISGLLGNIATFQTSRDGNVAMVGTVLGRATLFVHAESGTLRSESIPAGYALYLMVSPDGKRAGFVDENGTGGWFTVNSNAAQPAGPIHYLPKVSGLVEFKQNGRESAVAMSADGKLVVVPTSDSLVWWNLDTGTIAGSVPEPPNAANGVFIGPDDRTLLVETYDEQDPNNPTLGLLAVDMDTGTTRTVLTPAANETFLVSGDRSAVAICQQQGNGSPTLWLQRVSDGSVEGHPYTSQSISCQADLGAINMTGQLVAVQGNDETVTLVDLLRGSEVSRTGQAPTTTAQTQWNDAPDLISAGGSFYLASVDQSQLSYTKVPTRPEMLDVSDQALTNDGSKIISLLSDGSLQLRPSGTNGDRLLASAPPPQPLWTSSGDTRQLRLSQDGSLVVDREGPNVVTVRRTSTLRQTARIITDLPPASQDGTVQGGLTSTFDYFFDWTGLLITVAGTKVQQWDPLTGRQLAHFDAQSVVKPGADPLHVGVGAYPTANQVAVTVEGDPVIHIIDMTTGRVASTVTTNADDILAVEFDPSGRYFGLLRRTSIIELWQRDPLRKDLGPLRSIYDPTGATAWDTGFLDASGRYMIAANDSIEMYQIGDQAPVDSYEFGHPDGTNEQNPYKFISASSNGRVVLYADENGVGGPLVLDPAVWSHDLCDIIGHRSFTPDELAGLPASIPTPRVCAVSP